MNSRLIQFFVSTLILLVTIAIAFTTLAHAQESENLNLDIARVFYRTDGGVSIMYFNKESCNQEETKTQCMDRIMITTNENGLPFDDMSLEDVAKFDRKNRDKWRGEKGKGIWIDTSLVSKREKIQEFTNELEKELDKDNPNPSKVLKLQRLVEKTKDMPNPILSKEELAMLEKKQKNILARTAETIARVIDSATDSFKDAVSTIAQVFVGRLQVGSPSAPTGITVYDVDTGEPSCIVVRSGRLESISGECRDSTGSRGGSSPNQSSGGAAAEVILTEDGIQNLLDQQPQDTNSSSQESAPAEGEQAKNDSKDSKDSNSSLDGGASPIDPLEPGGVDSVEESISEEPSPVENPPPAPAPEPTPETLPTE